MPRLTTAVWRHRRQQMNDLMDALRLDALVFTSADFFQFATNFHTDVLPWERPIYAVVPRDGDGFLVMNELSTNHMRFSREQGKVWITDVSFYAEHPRVVERLPLPSELPELLAQRLARAGLARARVGVEGGSPALTAAAAQLPDLRLLPCTRECRALRWRKHEEELAVMAAIGSLADWLQERYRENIRPGRLVQELDCAMAALWVQEAAERFPGEQFEVIRAWTLSGPASASPHGDGASCGARIREGDVLVNILIPRLNGLAIENERTWFCGRPSAEQAACGRRRATRIWPASRPRSAAARQRHRRRRAGGDRARGLRCPHPAPHRPCHRHHPSRIPGEHGVLPSAAARQRGVFRGARPVRLRHRRFSHRRYRGREPRTPDRHAQDARLCHGP